jgi:ketosteroid isomerase-like protein
MSIKDFSEKFIKAENESLLNGNFGALEALIDPNFVYHHAPGPDLSREAYKQGAANMREAANIIQSDWKYLFSEGKLFALEFRGRFKFTGEMPGLPSATGKEVTSHYLCLFRLKNGKVIEGWANGSITGLG